MKFTERKDIPTVTIIDVDPEVVVINLRREYLKKLGGEFLRDKDNFRWLCEEQATSHSFTNFIRSLTRTEARVFDAFEVIAKAFKK